MAIESNLTVAATTAQPNRQPPQQPQQVEQAVTLRPVDEINRLDPEQQTDKPPKEGMQIQSAEKLDAAIERLNEMMKNSNRSLNFSIDKTSEKVIIQVRDTANDKVIRQIPTKEALHFAESLDRMMGLIFNEEV